MTTDNQEEMIKLVVSRIITYLVKNKSDCTSIGELRQAFTDIIRDELDSQ